MVHAVIPIELATSIADCNCETKSLEDGEAVDSQRFDSVNGLDCLVALERSGRLLLNRWITALCF